MSNDRRDVNLDEPRTRPIAASVGGGSSPASAADGNEGSREPSPLSFRAAHVGDERVILELVESAYRGESSRLGWTTEADLLGGQRTDREEVDAVLGDAAATVVLATSPLGIVGSVLVKKIEANRALIGMFAVRPLLQARGIGHALLKQAELVALERGAARARMTVIEQRRDLLAWYARRGYADTGEREPFPYGNPRFGLPKRADLQFVVLEKLLKV